MTKIFEGKTAIVTGASAGIGQATALTLAEPALLLLSPLAAKTA